jgi:hypothetical protein
MAKAPMVTAGPKRSFQGPRGQQIREAAGTAAMKAKQKVKPAPKPKAAAAPKKSSDGFSSDLKALAAKERAGIAAQRAAKPKVGVAGGKPSTKKSTNRGYDSYKKLMG